MAQATVDFHPEAVLEGTEAYVWYMERSPPVASAFVMELDAAIDSIAENPERWPRYLHGTRRFLLRRFPYGVVYREKSGSILVVAFAHCSRRPGYWKDR